GADTTAGYPSPERTHDEATAIDDGRAGGRRDRNGRRRREGPEDAGGHLGGSLPYRGREGQDGGRGEGPHGGDRLIRQVGGVPGRDQHSQGDSQAGPGQEAEGGGLGDRGVRHGGQGHLRGGRGHVEALLLTDGAADGVRVEGGQRGVLHRAQAGQKVA